MYIVETNAGFKYIYNGKASKTAYKTKLKALQAWMLVYSV